MARRRNAPISLDMTLREILQSHGLSVAKTNPAKKKRKFNWKKRWKSKSAMMKHMAKIRKLRKKK